jgi:SAM-dependent methyltransferase
MREGDNGAQAPQEIIYGPSTSEIIYGPRLSEYVFPNLEKRPHYFRPFTYEGFDFDPTNREVNQRLLLPTVEESDNGGLIIDIGCATGANAQMLIDEYARRGIYVNYLGIDLDPDAIDAARRNVHGNDFVNVEFKVGDATDLQSKEHLAMVESNSARKVYFTGIYHELQGTDEAGIPLKDKSLREIFRILEPGGQTVLVSGFLLDSFLLNFDEEGNRKLNKQELIRRGQVREAGMGKLGKKRDKNATKFELLTSETVVENLVNAKFEADQQDTVIERADLTMASHRSIAEDKMYLEGSFQDMKDTNTIDMYSKREAYQQALDDIDAKEPHPIIYPINILRFLGRKPVTPPAAEESAQWAA